MQKLHGDLEVEVVSGEDLDDRDRALFHIIPGDWSDVWVTVLLGETNILTTGVRKNAINAVWGERVIIPVCEAANYLDVSVWDKDRLRSQLVGRARLLLGDRDKAWKKDGPVYLEGKKGRVNMKINYTPAAQAEEENIEVPRTYFPMRRGGSMKFYQDAHVVSVPGSVNGGEGRAFEDMAEAFRKAKKFIYIAGWSLWTGTRLERDKKTLGELLKQKAKEGVRVLLLIWNEKFSAGLCAGLLSTFDEDTAKYFHKAGVYVEKVRRKGSSASPIKEQIVETVWTHHQKLILSDDGNGDLVAFLGGLDLTKGRWDTPDHELFNTLSGEHRGDFHNGFINVKESQGPREPWHDVHARLTGRSAIDLLRNFEERWRNQVREKSHLLVQSYEEDLLQAQESNVELDNNTTWEMQVVRSIDNNSAEFSSGRMTVLDSTEGRVIDRSLHRAAVRLVRQAQKFLYIENQYFIGSAQEWNREQDVCAYNLVPLEITQKIVGKIRAGEGFRVYLVLPMMPEGNPNMPIVKCSMRAILHFQFLTLQMMYRKIGEALREAGSSHHPTDYLLVLFLAKKESLAKVSRTGGADQPRPGSDESVWRQRAKFPIYVHSKLLLADDTLTLLGSANLNQRSLDGTRDTEVAVAARQVRSQGHHTPGPVSDGAVGALRRSLWAEHTSGLSEQHEALTDPSSLDAIRELKRLADEALETYVSGPADEESKCRFLRYPLEVSPDGSVDASSDMPNFPDFKVPVVGSRGVIPSIPAV